MLSLTNIYTLYFRLYFRLCICLNKLSINQSNSEIQTYKINGVRKIMQYTNRQEKQCNIQTDKNNRIRKTMTYTNCIRTTVKYKPTR